MILFGSHFFVTVKRKERNINNNLAVLPSHNSTEVSCLSVSLRLLVLGAGAHNL